MRPRSALHDYQLKMIERIKCEKEVMVWLGLGGGKTAAALTAILDLGVPAIVVGTKRIVEMTWPNEIKEWEHLAHLDYRACTGTETQRRKALRAAPQILGVNYESLQWLLTQKLDGYKMVIFDEISKMKSHSTNRYKHWMKNRHRFERIVGMTATPASESYVGLYAQYRTVISKPVLCGNITYFRQQFVTPIFKGMYTEYVVSPQDKKAIEDAIAPVTLVLDTPRRGAPTVVDVPVPWESPKVEQRYRDVEKKFVAEFAGQPFALASRAESWMKCRQLATGIFIKDELAEITSNAKFEAIREAYDELGGEPVLVFYQFVYEREILLGLLPGAEELRTPDLERFNRGEIPALVVHPRSAGYGLNLQGPCRHVFWSSLTPSGEEYLQANGRIDRQGQVGQVVIKRFVREKSVDLELTGLVEGKLTDNSQLIESMRGRC